MEGNMTKKKSTKLAQQQKKHLKELTKLKKELESIPDADVAKLLNEIVKEKKDATSPRPKP